MRKIEVTFRDRRNGNVVVKLLQKDYYWNAKDGSRFWWAEHGMSDDSNRSTIMYDDPLMHIYASRERPLIVVDMLAVDGLVVYQDEPAWLACPDGDMFAAQLEDAFDAFDVLLSVAKGHEGEDQHFYQRAERVIETLAAHPRAAEFHPIGLRLRDAYMNATANSGDIKECVEHMEMCCDQFYCALFPEEN